ncbi:hypothetical protein Hanom_Chr12g01159761 [Helianthus anomalus]
MRHMDTYLGTYLKSYHYGLDKESRNQIKQLKWLRKKYLTNILLHTSNKKKNLIIEEAIEFEKKSDKEKKALKDAGVAFWI